MKSPSPYFKTLENTWIHKYIFGCYYNRLGEKFKLNDTELPNDIIDEYKRLYQEKKDSDIQNFVKKFTNSNTFTSFYHHYWMGDVCDSYGVPLFMKTKKTYFYAKAYQDKFAKDKELFEQDMEKHRENKKKEHQKALKKKQEKSKPKRGRTISQSNQTKRYDDRNAVYINDPSMTTPSRKPKIFDDINAVYVDDAPIPKPSMKPKMFTDRNAVYVNDPPITKQTKQVMQSRKKIKTLIDKKLRKKKKKDIKKELRRLKLEMLSLS